MFKTKGKFKFELRDRDGNLKQESEWIDNLITNVARGAFAGLVSGVGGVATFTYLAVGSSATAPAATDTTLTSEISSNGLGRHAATVTLITTTLSNDTVQLVYTWTISGTQTINEVGVFNDSSVGTMATHALTGTVSAIATDQFTMTYQIQFT